MTIFTYPSIAVCTLLLGTSLSFVSVAWAASDSAKQPQMNHATMNHDQMKATNKTGSQSTEPGQGAFATIAEIVVILTNDPMTDWDKVDIAGLREHLVDMDELSLRASSTTAVFDDRIVFTITGSGRTLQAIQTMVPAHAGVLSRTTAWDAKGEVTASGATLMIKSNKPLVLKVVKALGFYGVMATGAHHQTHHLAMAKGDNSIHSHN